MSRSMRALELDYYKASSTSPWAGRVLLTIAIVFSGHLCLSYHDTREAIAQQQRELSQLPRPRVIAAASEPVARQFPATEIEFARETIQRLSTPWAVLFGALESAGRDGIALLAIEPDAKAGTVLISAQGRNYPAVLDYVARLHDNENFSNVHLVKHEVRHNEPQKPLAFSVSASWIAKP